MRLEDELLCPGDAERAQDELSAALRLDAMIAVKHAQLDRLRARADRMRALPGWTKADEAAMERLEAEVLTDYRVLTARQLAIRELLRRVPNEKWRAVLEMRYLQAMPFFRIAMDMHYDERQIYRYHRAGVRCVAVLRKLDAGNMTQKND